MIVASMDRAFIIAIDSLAPRHRRVLANLLAGGTEKEIAADLAWPLISVHESVRAVYRHFGVTSRAELSARIIRSLVRNQPSPPVEEGALLDEVFKQVR